MKTFPWKLLLLVEAMLIPFSMQQATESFDAIGCFILFQVPMLPLIIFQWIHNCKVRTATYDAIKRARR